MTDKKQVDSQEMEKVNGGVWKPQWIKDPLNPNPDRVPKIPNAAPTGVPNDF